MAKHKEEKTNVVRILEAAGIPCTAYEVPLEKGQLTGVVTSVTFMGVHYEIIVDVGGFKWMIQTTDFVDVDEHIGIELEPDAMVAELRTQGMTGIYLDLDGYPEDEQQSALAALTEAAGCGPEDVIHSGSGLLCYIPLGQE